MDARRARATMALAVVMAAAVAVPARAQDRPWAAGVVAGASRVWDDEGTLGPGPVVAATLGRRVTGRVTLEGLVLGASQDRSTPFLSWEADGLAVLGRGVFHLRGETARARPYLAAGAGLMRSTGTVTERDSHVLPGTIGPIVDRRAWDWTAFAWEGAVGVDVAVGSRAFVRGEAALTSGEFDRGRQLGVPEPPLWTTRLAIGGGVRF
jgi:hypothetical protein